MSRNSFRRPIRGRKIYFVCNRWRRRFHRLTHRLLSVIPPGFAGCRGNDGRPMPTVVVNLKALVAVLTVWQAPAGRGLRRPTRVRLNPASVLIQYRVVRAWHSCARRRGELEHVR